MSIITISQDAFNNRAFRYYVLRKNGYSRRMARHISNSRKLTLEVMKIITDEYLWQMIVP